eukprot:gene25207-56878_t
MAHAGQARLGVGSPTYDDDAGRTLRAEGIFVGVNGESGSLGQQPEPKRRRPDPGHGHGGKGAPALLTGKGKGHSPAASHHGGKGKALNSCDWSYSVGTVIAALNNVEERPGGVMPPALSRYLMSVGRSRTDFAEQVNLGWLHHLGPVVRRLLRMVDHTALGRLLVDRAKSRSVDESPLGEFITPLQWWTSVVAPAFTAMDERQMGVAAIFRDVEVIHRVVDGSPASVAGLQLQLDAIIETCWMGTLVTVLRMMARIWKGDN